MARRILNRRELRAASDAAERRETETEGEEEVEEEEEEDEDEDKDKDESADEEDAEAEAEAEGDDEDEEEKPKKKPKPKPKPKPKTTKPRKSRAAKITRMKVVWGVFNNSNARVQTFEYPRKAEADALAAKLTAEKKSTHFVNPVKEPMEEKPEDKEAKETKPAKGK